MKIYHVEFAKTGCALSGGETAMLEQIKYFASQGYHNVLLTTDNGKETYRRIGLTEGSNFSYKTIDSYAFEQRHHIFISYLVRTFAAVRLVRALSIEDSDVLFCHSDFFPNSIPFFILARKSARSQLFYWFHMLAPGIFRGFEGHFTGRYAFPRPAIIHHRLNQIIYKLLTSRRGIVLTVNEYYRVLLRDRYPHNHIYIIKHFGGTDALVPTTAKEFDLVWMGRFHPQKGLFEFIAVLDQLGGVLSKVTAVVVGGGNLAMERDFFAEIKKRKLTGVIHSTGFLTGPDKYRYLAKSRLFLMTSFYESFGLVVLEAMRCGTPVIAYRLPVYEVFKRGIVFVPVLDRAAMVAKAKELLEDDEKYRQLREQAIEFSSQFSWEKTGKEILALFANAREIQGTDLKGTKNPMKTSS